MSTFTAVHWSLPTKFFGKFGGEPESVMLRTIIGGVDDASKSNFFYCATIEDDARSLLFSRRLKGDIQLYRDPECTSPAEISVPNVGTVNTFVVENIENLSLQTLRPLTRSPEEKLLTVIPVSS